jgi:hypothetical protein
MASDVANIEVIATTGAVDEVGLDLPQRSF